MAELEPAPADGPLILASALARAGRHQEAVASLLGGGSKSPEPLTLLTAAQILLAAGEVKTASMYALGIRCASKLEFVILVCDILI